MEPRQERKTCHHGKGSCYAQIVPHLQGLQPLSRNCGTCLLGLHRVFSILLRSAAALSFPASALSLSFTLT